MKTLIGMAAAIALTGALDAAAQSPRPLIPAYDGTTIDARCDGELAKLRAQKATMERTRGAGRILAEWNRLSIAFGDFVNPVYLLANVHPDRATRDAAQRCVEKLIPFETELFQSERLHARVKALAPRDLVDKVYRAELLDFFEDSGVALPPDKRARAKALRDEIENLALKYQKNVNEERTTVAIAPEEAQGMPRSWIDARKRDEQGRLIVTLDYPTYLPFLENAVNEDARRRVWTAKLKEGGTVNLELLDRVLQLRHEMVQLYGLPDYAAFALRRRMAQTPAAVNEFLASVKKAVDEVEARELEELRADKAALLGKPLAEVKLYRWDVAFHQERVRRSRYKIDQEALRAYFPTETSVRYALTLAEMLYGIRFVEVDAPRWHPDVRYFDVREAGADGKPGEFIGGVYLDLYPREGKYNHAAAFPVRAVSTLAKRTPISVLVTNFDRRGLNHEELETLLHEFGHVLHGVLSKTRYADLGGTSVKRDFVEAPSQMFEEWARREEPLALFAKLCPECPRLSEAQVEQLRAARRFGNGIRYARQWQYAAYDMQLHTGTPKPALATWIEIERASRLGHVEGTTLPASFGHLVGGYAAGYYGYMWSEVLALDMLSGFGGKLLNAEAGRRYRKAILALGGEKPPHALVEAFLGRAPSSGAFYAEITGQRK